MQPSSLFCSRVVLLCMYLIYFMLAIMINNNQVAAINLPPNVSVPAILGFGDSIIDPGNNNNINSLIKCNFPPYGKDFMGGTPTGRFSNGRIPTDFVAEGLSIKQSVPAYLDPNLNPADIPTGVSFASGAAGFDPLTAKIASAIPLSVQLVHFKEYIGKLTLMVGQDRTDFILTNSLFLVVAGSDDIANTYFDTPFRRNHYNVDSYTNLMLNSASNFVQDLYKLGARRIAVFGAPPIGCVPSQRTIGGGIVRECAENYNQAAQLFNSKLSSKLDSLSNQLNARIVYIDIYNMLLELIQNPVKYGFEQVAKGCCGTGLIEVTLLCNKFDALCEDDTKYLFWDSYHPTEKGYQILSENLLEKYSDRLY